MRYLAAVTAAFLFTFMLVSVPAFSQGDDKPAQQEDKAKDKDKDKDKDHARPMDQDQTKRDERSTRPEEKSAPRPDERNARQDNDARRDNNARHDNDNMRHDNNGARPAGGYQGQQNGGYAQGNQRQEHHGQKIPQEKFRASFGREHRFHVDRSRIYNQQQPIVVYGGYQFQLVDAWPADWDYADDCYVDYDDVSDQYYLYDYMHPGMRIAVFVIGE